MITIEGVQYSPSQIFCDCTKVLSHNCILNFIMGARGCGKTYGLLRYYIKHFIQTNNKFVYLRRYDTELNELDELFTSINQLEFPEYVIDVRGKNFYCAKKELLYDNKGKYKSSLIFQEKYHCGKAIALTQASKIKSKDFINYNNLCFEEFIIKQAHVYYLKNEVTVFMELIETIFRHRKVRVFFFGNNMTTINPYFTYFKIKNPNLKGITKYKLKNSQTKNILVWYYYNELFIKYKLSTDIGLLENNTEYGQYAIYNESLYDDENFIEKKTSQATFKFSIKYCGDIIGFWLDFQKGLLFASFKYPKDWNNHYACTNEDMSINTFFFRRMKNNHSVTLLKDSFSYGFLRYENIKVKNIVTDVIELFNLY